MADKLLPFGAPWKIVGPMSLVSVFEIEMLWVMSGIKLPHCFCS